MENEIKVGEWIRTDNGIIGKYVKYRGIEDTIETNNKWIGFDIERDIVKHSPNLIDLIQCGDYVNGKEVINIYEAKEEAFLGYFNEKTLELKNDIYETIPTEYLVYNKDIKTIVTKEQFENISYKVKE